MKNKFAALIMATFVATPVMAQNVDNQVFANQNVKAIELSQTEMQETQGEVAPIVALAMLAGANAGAWKNHAKSYLKDGRPASVGSTLIAAGKGAIGGRRGKF